jgi:hypothetical protein
MGGKPVTTHEGRKWSTRARAGWVLIFLWKGAKLTTVDIAKITGLTRRGVRYMMDDLAAHFPIVLDGEFWQWMKID